MADSKLTHEAKAEIRQYLSRILLPTGGLVGLVLLGLGWAVSELGVGIAYNKALEGVQNSIVTMAAQVSNSAARADRARQDTETARRDTEAAREEVIRIRDDLKIAKISSIVGDAAQTLSNDENFVNAVAEKTNSDWTATIEKLNGTDKEWGNARGEYGYGFQAWKHQNKSVQCPNGSYVTGIKVRYSGTCLEQCDADGGIVREIVVTCHSIFR